MSESFDVIIIGGGIIGLSTAYQLKTHFPDIKYLLLEKENQLGQRNTGKSAACFRDMFTNEVNRRAAGYTIEHLKSINEERHIGLKLKGYLWLLSQLEIDKLHTHFDEIVREGIDMSELNPDEIKQIVPNITCEPNKQHKADFESYINDPELNIPEPGFSRFFKEKETDNFTIDTIVKGYFGKNCGFLEPNDLVNFLSEEVLTHNNAKIRKGIEVKKILYKIGKVIGIETKKGEQIHSDKVIVAASIWSNELLKPLDISVDAVPNMRQYFYVKPLDNRLNDVPMVVFPNGTYIRSSTGELMVGYAHPNEDKVERHTGRKSLYEYGIRFYLSAYLQEFDKLRSENYIWGHYHITPDGSPLIINRDDGISAICGCSGSGIMKSLYLGYLEAHSIAEATDKLSPLDKKNVLALDSDRFIKDTHGNYSDKSKWIIEKFVI